MLHPSTESIISFQNSSRNFLVLFITQRGGAPATSNIASDDALTRASRVVEQVAIEHAIEKYRLLEKMHSHHQLFSGAESLDPTLQALMRGIAADARPLLVRHHGDVDIRQKLLSELLLCSKKPCLGHSKRGITDPR